VQTSDVYVLIAGFRYGSLVPGGLELSYTELEFDAAAEADLPRLVFLLDEKAAWPAEIRGPQPDARQQAFRARLLGNDGETRLTVAFVRSAEELEITLRTRSSTVHARHEDSSASPRSLIRACCCGRL
jgi:hypothetical protein